MKRNLFCIIGLAVFGVVGVTVCLGMTLVRHLEEARSAGDHFLRLVGAGELDKAYQSASIPFRQAETPQSFQRVVVQGALREFVSSSWARRQVSTSCSSDGTITLARLEGTIRLTTGATHDMTMELLHEGGTWKVFNFRTKIAGG